MGGLEFVVIWVCATLTVFCIDCPCVMTKDQSYIERAYYSLVVHTDLFLSLQDCYDW